MIRNTAIFIAAAMLAMPAAAAQSANNEPVNLVITTDALTKVEAASELICKEIVSASPDKPGDAVEAHAKALGFTQTETIFLFTHCTAYAAGRADEAKHEAGRD